MKENVRFTLLIGPLSGRVAAVSRVPANSVRALTISPPARLLALPTGLQHPVARIIPERGRGLSGPPPRAATQKGSRRTRARPVSAFGPNAFPLAPPSSRAQPPPLPATARRPERSRPCAAPGVN